MKALYPSLIAANQLDLQSAIKSLEDYCSGYHLDIMDGHFVPNVTFGSDVVNSIARSTYKTIWVQLLVERPDEWLDKLFLPVDSIVSFHIESEGEKVKIIDRIKKKNWRPSIAINPKTDVGEIFTYLNMLSQVLVMSVTPGFSGQEFLPDTINKVDRLVSYRQTSGLDFRIGMDGGIDTENIVMIKDHGVDDFSVGSGIFNSQDPAAMAKKLESLISN